MEKEIPEKSGVSDLVVTPRLQDIEAMLDSMREKQTPIPPIVTQIMKSWRFEHDARSEYVHRLENQIRSMQQAEVDRERKVVPVTLFDRIERHRRVLSDEVRNLRQLVESIQNVDEGFTYRVRQELQEMMENDEPFNGGDAVDWITSWLWPQVTAEADLYEYEPEEGEGTENHE